MSPSDTEPDLVIRPVSLRNLTTAALAAGAGWLLASAGFLLRSHGAGRAVAGVLDIMILIILAAFIVRIRPRLALTVTGRTLIWSTLVRDRVVLDHAGSGRVVEADANLGRGPWAWRSQLWIVVDDSGVARLRLNRKAWNHDELEMVRRRLELPIDLISDPIPGEQLRQRYPGALSWCGVHPMTTSVLTIAALIAIATVGQRVG